MSQFMKSFLLALLPLSIGLSLPLSAAEAGKWTVLFDGTSTEHWRAYRGESFPNGGWKVEDGVLTSIGSGDRVDIITRDDFTNFELELEWRVEARGNSGIFYRVNEEAKTIWHAAPEVQILDDGSSGNTVQSAGSLYDLVAPSEQKRLRPVGEFNKTRLIVRGSQVEHWLNGEKIASYDLDDADLKEKIKKSKFGKYDDFGRTETGPIGLQHHGDTVGFRNIRIRQLPSPIKT